MEINIIPRSKLPHNMRYEVQTYNVQLAMWVTVYSTESIAVALADAQFMQQNGRKVRIIDNNA